MELTVGLERGKNLAVGSNSGQILTVIREKS